MSKRRKKRNQSNLKTVLSSEVQKNILSGKQKPKFSLSSSTNSELRPTSQNSELEKYFDSGSILSTLEKQLALLEKELNGIKRISDQDINQCTPFQKAQWLIYEGLLALTETVNLHDYLEGNLFSKDTEAREQIHLGGQILYDEGGMSNLHGMHDTLLWLFIPDAMERTVDFLWHGIGDWKA